MDFFQNNSGNIPAGGDCVTSSLCRRLFNNKLFNYALLILLGCGLGLSSLLLGASVYGVPMFLSYFASPLLITLNLLPPVLLILLFYFLSGKAWLSYLLTAVPVLALSITGYFKMQIRAVPLIASDFAFVSEAMAVVSNYTLTFNWKLYAVGTAFMFGLAVSLFVMRRREKNAFTRFSGSLITALFSAVLAVSVYAHPVLYDFVEGGFDAKPWASTEYYISKGFLYPFINSVQYALTKTPEGFDRTEAERIFASYENTDIPDGKKVNYISIMLEAYTDLSRFGVLDFDIDVYAPLHRVQEESIHGELIVNTFGGGTIDTERLFLTGYTALPAFNSKTNSYVHYLKNEGYYTEGFHAGDSWFYDRTAVNSYLGFDNYYFLEDYEDSTRRDSFFFPTVRELYDARDFDMPYFSYNLSYQNHGAYDTESAPEPYYIAQNGMSDESFFTLNNYFDGVYDTTQRIESFIDSFREDTEPVVIIIFGDHMPWMGNYESVYKEIGVNLDVATEAGFYNYYSTPYLIWANDAAKGVLGSPFTGNGGTYSPCFLLGEVFRYAGIGGEPYMQALRELKEFTDIINTPTGLLRTNGTLTHTPDDALAQALDDFAKLEYYRLHTFNTNP